MNKAFLLVFLCVASAQFMRAAEATVFWNGHAKQFIFTPSFDFRPIKGATAYRFTIASHSFEAADPHAALTSILGGRAGGNSGVIQCSGPRFSARVFRSGGCSQMTNLVLRKAQQLFRNADVCGIALAGAQEV